jgi:hypothetical protein
VFPRFDGVGWFQSPNGVPRRDGPRCRRRVQALRQGHHAVRRERSAGGRGVEGHGLLGRAGEGRSGRPRPAGGEAGGSGVGQRLGRRTRSRRQAAALRQRRRAGAGNGRERGQQGAASSAPAPAAAAAAAAAGHRGGARRGVGAAAAVPAVPEPQHQVLLLQQLQRQPAAPLLQGLPPLLDRGRRAPQRPRRRRPPQEPAPRRRTHPLGRVRAGPAPAAPAAPRCGGGPRPRPPRPAPFLPDVAVPGLRRAVAGLPGPPVLSCDVTIRWIDRSQTSRESDVAPGWF